MARRIQVRLAARSEDELKDVLYSVTQRLKEKDITLESLTNQIAQQRQEREDLEQQRADLEERIEEARQGWFGANNASPPTSPSLSPPGSPTAGPPVFGELSPLSTPTRGSPAAGPSSRKRGHAECSEQEVEEGGLPPRKRRRVECPPGQSSQETEGERREEERDQDDVDLHVAGTDPRVPSVAPDREDLDACWHAEPAGGQEEGAGPFMQEDPLQDGPPMEVDAERVAPGPERARRRKARPTPSVLPRRSRRLVARRLTDDRVYYVTRSGRSVRPPDRYTP